MKQNMIIFILSILFILPAYSQDKKNDKTKKEEKKVEEDKGKVYSDITLEDFESSAYSKKNLKLRVSKEQKSNAIVRNQYPAPLKNSTKYLGIKLYGKSGDVLSIIPAKKLSITKHCRKISVWIYGKNFTGELSMILKDSNNQSHRLSFGKLNFLGWKKLSVKIHSDIAQQDKYLSQKTEIEILRFLYNPGNTARLPIWNYFYMDDIIANVRAKYSDKQSDEW